MDAKLLYRPAEAAEALSVSRAKLYQWLSAGELGSVNLGASRRIPAADLQAFVARLRGERGDNAPVDGSPADALAS